MNEPPAVADDAGDVSEYRASDGSLLRYRHWRPHSEPRAHVVALHGIQSHSGWYGYSSRRLAEAGIDVRFLDRRGSGLNQTTRQQTEICSRLIDDVVEFAHQVGEERAGHATKAPLLLLGLSWGARLAAAVCHRYPDLFDGLVLLYPGICTHVRPSAAQQLLLRLLNRLGGRRLTVPLPLRPEQFASQPRWQAFIRDDPAAVRRVPVPFLLASEQLAQMAMEGLARLTLPRLVMLAGGDEIVDLTRTRELLSRIPPRCLHIVEYANARHTLEFEPPRDRFAADLIQWIESIERRH